MEYYKFIVRKSDQEFEAIIHCIDNQVSSMNYEKYSCLVTDEQTARANFTLTGHLPSEKFEELLKQAKEDVNPKD